MIFNGISRLLNGLPVPLYLLLDFVVLPDGLEHVAALVSQLANAVPPPVFELAVVEISADHGGTHPLGRIVLPLSVVVVAVGPAVDALAVFLAALEFALVLVAVGVLHDSGAVVLAFGEGAGVGEVVFLFVDALAAEFVVLPLALVAVAVFVDDLATTAFDVALPVALVGPVRSLLRSLAAALSLLELTCIGALLDERIIVFAGVLPPLHDDLHTVAVFEVVLEVTHVDHILTVPQLAHPVVLAIEERALVDVPALLGTADQDPPPVGQPVQHLPFVFGLPSLADDAHIPLVTYFNAELP